MRKNVDNKGKIIKGDIKYLFRYFLGCSMEFPKYRGPPVLHLHFSSSIFYVQTSTYIDITTVLPCTSRI